MEFLVMDSGSGQEKMENNLVIENDYCDVY